MKEARGVTPLTAVVLKPHFFIGGRCDGPSEKHQADIQTLHVLYLLYSNGTSLRSTSRVRMSGARPHQDCRAVGESTCSFASIV